MNEKEYLLLLRKIAQRKAQEKRIMSCFNENCFGRVVVTTGIPKEFNEGVTTYVNQKTMCYEDYITSEYMEIKKLIKL